MAAKLNKLIQVVIEGIEYAVIAIMIVFMLLKAFLLLGPREFRAGLEEAVNGRKE